MSSSPPPSSDSSSQDVAARKALPFEPKKRVKKAEDEGSTGKKVEGKVDTKAGAKPKKSPKLASKPVPPKSMSKPAASGAGMSGRAATRASAAIPDVVSKRMAKRMALFCGVPSFLAIATFVVSYYIVSQHLMDLPTSAVLLVSLGFFGLGVLGLSYGLFSASWEEDQSGSLLGVSEFRTNLGRTISAWRSQRSQP